MLRATEHPTLLLIACFAAMVFAAACDNTASSSRDAGAELADARDVALADAREESPAFDASADVDPGDATAAPDVFDVPIPEAAACGRSADVPIVLSPDVFVPLDVYENCRTVLPADPAPRCVPLAEDPCTCVDGLSGTRTCRDDRYWGSCRCVGVDAGMDAPVGSDGSIPRITLARLIAPQSGSRATSQRPTFRWVMPAGLSRARVEVCADRPCTRMLMQQEVTGTSWRPTERLAQGVVFWRVQALGADGGVAWASATWEVGIRHRDLPVDTSYGTLKDFNGDGYDDAVVYSDGTRFQYNLRVYPGSLSGLHADQFRGMNAPYRGTDGVFDTGGFGHAFAVGDMNGDGLADLTVGADLVGEPGAASQGRVYVYLSTREGILPECSQTLLPSRLSGNTGYGSAVSVGDFNGDGYSDTVVIGGGLDRLMLHLGGPSGTGYIPADTMSGVVGNVQFIGDVNGDGYADVCALAGRNPEVAELLVLYGNPLSRLSFHMQGPIRGRYPNNWYGDAMEWGDYNSDGYADMIVGGRGYADAYHGSIEGLTLVTPLVTPPSTSEGIVGAEAAFGGRVSAAGYLDGDGRPEIAIGASSAPRNGSQDGRVFVYSAIGGRIPTLWSHVLAPVTRVVDFGTVAIPGDLNGDGLDDLMVGAPANAVVFASREVYIYHGSVGEWWCAPSLVIQGNGAYALGQWIR